VPNFVVIGQTVTEILQFLNFHDGGHPPSWIKFDILMSGGVERVNVRHLAKFPQSVKPSSRYHDFSIFKMADVSHIEF